jgi:hypothetical protein
MAAPNDSPLGFTEAHRRVITLCDHFDARRHEIMAPGYKEDAARNEFITPFFEALGWDVRNTAHRSVYGKDVVTEKREDIAGTARSADYAFRRPGTHLTAFFVEAKKPSVDVRGHEPCYQAVLYGWNATTPLVVLTDFEQFLILDARSRPDKGNASRHILRQHGSYTYADYRDSQKFAEIWGLFAREHVSTGSLDKAAAALPRLSGRLQQDDLLARGTRPVDEEFLAQMELWRKQLAKSLKRSNHHLDGDRLTSLTQRILDRLVFLRFLEDRGIERDVTFADFGRGSSAWREFLRVSKRLNARYNGIIYKPDPNGCEDPALVIDDSTFASVVANLVPQNSDYLFGSISVTILGSIYERFLGNVIVARDKTADVEPKPEVRKAGGVYYTPDYIVRYIIEQTVGRSITGKKPSEIEKLRFADIACGSGSFLVEVFASLIRYYLAWYLADGAERWEKKGVLRKRDIDGDYVLTLAEKRRILLACIFGVDVDPSAVEVTQLSLYLRLMEDESFPSTQTLFDFEKHALLPDLRENIICGNSLIETDIADLFGLSNEEQERIRPLDFKWAFPKVFGRKEKGADGFDAVVGNPPWVSLSGKFGNEFLSADQLQYLINRYEGNTYMPNMYEYFVARGITLTKKGGAFSLIVPDRLGFNGQFIKLRRRILNETSLRSLLYKTPFPGIIADTLIFVADKATPSPNHEVTVQEFGGEPMTRKQSAFASHPELKFEFKGDGPTLSLIKRIVSRPRIKTLSDFVQCTSGFGGKSTLITSTKTTASQIRTMKGDSIGRYELRKTYWFEFKRENITGRTTDKQKLGASEKILLRKTGNQIIATYDDSGIFPEQSLYFLFNPKTEVRLKFILGILNSRFLNWYFQTMCLTNEKTIAQVKMVDLIGLPIPTIDFTRQDEVAVHDQFIKLVDKMLVAKKAQAEAADGGKREHWERQCQALDRQIDGLVCDLYDLTEEEIAVVAG